MKTRLHRSGLLAFALLASSYAVNATAAPADSKPDSKKQAVVQAFFKLKIPFLPLPKNVADGRYDPSLNVIYWNSSAAVQVADDSGKGTGKFISPAMLLLDAMAHAIAHAQSAPGYANLEATPDPLFGTLEQRRVIAGLSQSDAHAKLHDQTPAAVAEVDKILAMPDGNGVENAVAATTGEPVRTNNKPVLQDGKVVEGVTYRIVDNPTWHSN